MIYNYFLSDWYYLASDSDLAQLFPCARHYFALSPVVVFFFFFFLGGGGGLRGEEATVVVFKG